MNRLPELVATGLSRRTAATRRCHPERSEGPGREAARRSSIVSPLPRSLATLEMTACAMHFSRARRDFRYGFVSLGGGGGGGGAGCGWGCGSGWGSGSGSGSSSRGSWVVAVGGTGCGSGSLGCVGGGAGCGCGTVGCGTGAGRGVGRERGSDMVPVVNVPAIVPGGPDWVGSVAVGRVNAVVVSALVPVIGGTRGGATSPGACSVDVTAPPAPSCTTSYSCWSRRNLPSSPRQAMANTTATETMISTDFFMVS